MVYYARRQQDIQQSRQKHTIKHNGRTLRVINIVEVVDRFSSHRKSHGNPRHSYPIAESTSAMTDWRLEDDLAMNGWSCRVTCGGD